MKIATVSLLDYAITEGKSRTAQLTAEHKPEMLPDGWIRFWCDGAWHRVPPTLVRRITEVNPVTEIVRETEKLGGYEAEARQYAELQALDTHTESVKEDSAPHMVPKRRGRPAKQ